MAEEMGVADVRRLLVPQGIEVLELDADTSTAPLAAAALGTDVASIVKSLPFVAGDEPVLVLASGDRSVDLGRMRAVFGVESIRLAKPSEVLSVAGYRVGGVPPLAHRTTLRTLFDRRLLKKGQVYAAAGAGNAIFPIEPDRLVAMTGAEIVDL